MTRTTNKITTFAIAILVILTSYFVMASHISREVVVARADANMTTVDRGTEVQLYGSDSSGVSPLSYHWYFGDGSESRNPNPQHTYPMEGIYTASLVVKDGNNVYDLKTIEIAVINYYPNAIAGSDISVIEDEVVNFDASESYDQNDDIESYEWNFGDGSTAAEERTSHVYENAGFYHVTLTVVDNDGAFDMDTITVAVKNKAPSTNGIANGDIDDELTIYEDDTVTFDGSQSTDTPSDLPSLTYAWDFGDGSKGYGFSTSHTYTKQGAYLATLRVTDDNAAYTEDTIAIYVLNAPPVAGAGQDQTVDEGDTVFFDGTASTDTPSDKPLLEHSWSFGGKGTNPTYNWYDDSTNNVELTVTDDDLAEDKESITINVKNVAPTASIDAAYVLVDFRLRAAGKKWQAVDLKVTEPNKEVSAIGIVRYPGSPDDQAVTADDVKINIAEDVTATVYYTPKANGATPTWLTLTFEDGTSTTLFRSFNNQKPEEWVWVHDMNEHISGKPIHFEGSVYDPGTDDITVEWDFGDGSTPTTTHYLSNGNHPMNIREHHVRTFTYGVYAISLQAVDDDGGMGSTTLVVTNTERLTSTNVAPKASSSGGKTVLEDEPVTLTGVGEDTGSDQGILTYTWYLGDGTIKSGPTVTHAYTKAGTYYPTLVVNDDEGGIGTTSELVEVLNPIPTAVANANHEIIDEDDSISLDALSSSDTPSDLPLLKYAWDFGDNSKGYGITTSHRYTKSGSYDVVLTVTDDNGAKDAATKTIIVENVVPSVRAAIRQTVDEDELIFFEVSASDTPSDEPLLDYIWDFGDGSVGYGSAITHAFTTEGSYIVKINVTDDDGALSERSKTITVTNPVPMVFGGFEKSFYGPQMDIMFQGRGFDTPSDQSTLKYVWDFGDGTTITGMFDDGVPGWSYGSGVEAEGEIVYHKYTTTTAQTYTVTFTVTDLHGAATVWTKVINIQVDSDGDQLLDGDELAIGLNPFDYDTDGDWLIDYYELNPPNGVEATDPTMADMDFDGCSDWEEVWPGEDGYITYPDDEDSDDDGLTDCNEYYTRTFKTKDRYKINFYLPSPLSDEPLWPGTDVSLSNVHSSASTKIMRAEVRVGVTHPTSIGNLRLAIDRNDGTEVVLLDMAGNDLYFFESFDLFELGFTQSDFAQPSTWNFNAGDYFSFNGGGFVEYFEIHITTRTDPNNDDSDNDGLNDFEEIFRADDGWITDPLKSDTDGDTISDSEEVNGWQVDGYWESYRTDPTRRDTDRDGFEDDDDLDPLHNLMISIWIKGFQGNPDSKYDGDYTLPDGTKIPNPPEVFFYIAGYSQYQVWTARTEGFSANLGGEFIYTYEIPDNVVDHGIRIDVWNDNGESADTKHHMTTHDEKRWLGRYNTLDSDGEACYVTDGNSPGIKGFDVEFCIKTKRFNRIPVLFLDPVDSDPKTDESLLCWSDSDNQNRYMGEDEYYLLLLQASSPYTGSYQLHYGWNAIIVPRSVFMASELKQVLDDNKDDGDDLPEVLKDLNFGGYDSEKTTTSGSVAGIIATQKDNPVTGGDAKTLIDMLLKGTPKEYDSDTESIQDGQFGTIAEVVDIYPDDLMTMNFADDLIGLIPIVTPDIGPLGKPNEGDDGWGFFLFDWAADLVDYVVDSLVAFADFVADLVVTLITEYVNFVIHIIGELVDLVWKLVEFVVEMVLKLFDWIMDFVRKLIETFVKPVVDTLNAIFESYVGRIAEVLVEAKETYDGASWDSVGQELKDRFGSALLGRLYPIAMAISTAAMVILYITSPLTSIFSFLLSFLQDTLKSFIMDALFKAVPIADDVEDWWDRINGVSSPEDAVSAAREIAEEYGVQMGTDFATSTCAAGFELIQVLSEDSPELSINIRIADVDESGTIAAIGSFFFSVTGLVLAAPDELDLDLTGLDEEDKANLRLLGGVLSSIGLDMADKALSRLPQIKPLAYVEYGIGLAGLGMYVDGVADCIAG